MSGASILRREILAALRADASLMTLVNGIEDGGAPRQSPPFIRVGELFASEWGARGVEGLAVRVPFTLVDRADGGDRIAAAADRIGVAMAALPAEADGWRIVAVLFDRQRSIVAPGGQWSLLIDYRARMSREI